MAEQLINIGVHEGSGLPLQAPLCPAAEHDKHDDWCNLRWTQVGDGYRLQYRTPARPAMRTPDGQVVVESAPPRWVDVHLVK